MGKLSAKQEKSLGWIPLVAILLLIPSSIYFSIKLTGLASQSTYPRFAGLDNYMRMFLEDELAPKALFYSIGWGAIIAAVMAFVSLIPKKMIWDKSFSKRKNTVYYILLEVGIPVVILIVQSFQDLSSQNSVAEAVEVLSSHGIPVRSETILQIFSRMITDPFHMALALEVGTFIVLLVWIIDHVFWHGRRAKG